MRPTILPIRERADLMREVLVERLDTVLPLAMREAGLDMWIVLCQEDDYDPVFRTLMPMDVWAPIVQALVFHDRGDAIERLNISMAHTGDLYPKPWHGHDEREQWAMLRQVVAERDPRRIGINIGRVQWAAGGLTHNLYCQLTETLGPELSARLTSAEPLVTRWLATLTDRQIALYDDVVSVAHWVLAACLSPTTIAPEVTTTTDLEWHYWQTVVDIGLELSFRPFFSIIRSDEARAEHSPDDRIIRPGDMVHSDVGLRYLGLCTDHQEVAYVLGEGETGPPAGLQALMASAHRLQDIYLGEFAVGLTGNELLARILSRARAEGLPEPRVYSHSLGHFLHEPGPLIGLPWEQEACAGRGDVRLEAGYAFTMELSVTGLVAEWGGQRVTMPLEQDVVFTPEGCRVLDRRQESFHLI